jgi:hypothetical protein
LQLPLEEHNLDQLWGIILDYLRLIAAGLKSEADLRGVLVKEAKLRPDEAKDLAREIMVLYFG